MYIEVRHVVLTLKEPHLDFDEINKLLHVALEYGLCDVSLALDQEYTRFGLHFKQIRTSVFVEQWVIFWLRPFGFEYELNFDDPGNGKELAVSSGVCV